MPSRVTGSASLKKAPSGPPRDASADGLPSFDVVLPSEPCRVEQARHSTNAWLKQRCGMTDDRSALLLLVVSELCANAIQHGRSEVFGLCGRMRSDGSVRLEVRDWSPSAVPLPQRAEPMDEGGRGLFLVDAFVADDLGGAWGFEDDGTVAWCEVPLRADGSACASPPGSMRRWPS
ncbi:ATP-binding protein [Streptomyces sp. W16]|uniref:ATP-binding protein n=1 Tax=Streptomyces sp. W16 TaxID=3076631 RepID=UPI00295BFEEB|nr:ATP-binding protein [Streptomyces sp. W16]MDV9169143.1 ATP-binding protein [Streptomyces sp. W16]